MSRARVEAAGIELVEVPAGCYLTGVSASVPRLARAPRETWDGYPRATPETWVDVERPFWISRGLITERQLYAIDPRAGAERDEPADLTSRNADRYAPAIRTPTWWEWEIAVRGPEPFLYPWGNELDVTKLRLTASDDLVLIDDFGDYAKSTSPFGLRDVARIGGEWNRVDNARLPPGAAIPDDGGIVRSASDCGAMAYLVPGVRPSTGGDLRLAARAFSGPIAACYGLPRPPGTHRYLYATAAFRWVVRD
jgi:formylglycine-generating enzyme required for sulfatase activity